MLSRLANVVDEVWSLTVDGRWHSRKTLAEESSFDPSAVNAALSFLVRYGFVQSSGEAGMRVRAVGGPSPKETVRMLSALLLDEGQGVLYL
jgi:DNA-binding transcriptional regulator YhcF (GntR family)